MDRNWVPTRPFEASSLANTQIPQNQTEPVNGLDELTPEELELLARNTDFSEDEQGDEDSEEYDEDEDDYGLREAGYGQYEYPSEEEDEDEDGDDEEDEEEEGEEDDEESEDEAIGGEYTLTETSAMAVGESHSAGVNIGHSSPIFGERAPAGVDLEDQISGQSRNYYISPAQSRDLEIYRRYVTGNPELPIDLDADIGRLGYNIPSGLQNSSVQHGNPASSSPGFHQLDQTPTSDVLSPGQNSASTDRDASSPIRKRRWTAGSDEPAQGPVGYNRDLTRNAVSPASRATSSLQSATTQAYLPEVYGVANADITTQSQGSPANSGESALFRTPASRHQSQRHNWAVVPPRWQPDSEATDCPICHRAFTMLNRKHHCRKCGRVVCGGCSPHRITIPRQFIVRPPNSTNNRSSIYMRSGGQLNFVDLTVEGDNQNFNSTPSTPSGFGGPFQAPDQDTDFLNPALGGGEEVRLCNPCVPDPNPDPPPRLISQASQSGSDLVGSSPTWPASGPQWPDPNRTGGSGTIYYPTPPLSHANSEDTSSRATFPRLFPSSRHSIGSTSGLFGFGGLSQPGAQGQQIPAPSTGTFSRQRSFSNMVGSSSLHRHLDYASTSGYRGSPPSASRQSPSALSSFILNRPQPGLQSNVIRPNFDQLTGAPGLGVTNNAGMSQPQRHASGSSTLPPSGHHHRLSSSQVNPLPMPPQQARARPRYQETDICPICARLLPPRGPGGSEAAREAHVRDCIEQRDPGSAAANSATQMQHRMLTFAATEKDCLASQECSICMEEYEVGDELARLECLCKFHKKCIVGWFKRKLECPVHKV